MFSNMYRELKATERSLLFRRMHIDLTGEWRAVTAYPNFMCNFSNIHFHCSLCRSAYPLCEAAYICMVQEGTSLSYVCMAKQFNSSLGTRVLILSDTSFATNECVSRYFEICIGILCNLTTLRVAHSGYGIPGPISVRKSLLMTIISGQKSYFIVLYQQEFYIQKQI